MRQTHEFSTQRLRKATNSRETEIGRLNHPGQERAGLVFPLYRFAESRGRRKGVREKGREERTRKKERKKERQRKK